jgi:hypothetical protein
LSVEFDAQETAARELRGKQGRPGPAERIYDNISRLRERFDERRQDAERFVISATRPGIFSISASMPLVCSIKRSSDVWLFSSSGRRAKVSILNDWRENLKKARNSTGTICATWCVGVR